MLLSCYTELQHWETSQWKKSFVRMLLRQRLISLCDPSHTVAKRVIQHSPHFLGVDEKMHEVIVTEHCESLDPDKVYFLECKKIQYANKY